jgi:hypothetical protein
MIKVLVYGNQEHQDLYHGNLEHQYLYHGNIEHQNLYHGNIEHQYLYHGNIEHQGCDTCLGVLCFHDKGIGVQCGCDKCLGVLCFHDSAQEPCLDMAIYNFLVPAVLVFVGQSTACGMHY